MFDAQRVIHQTSVGLFARSTPPECPTLEKGQAGEEGLASATRYLLHFTPSSAADYF